MQSAIKQLVSIVRTDTNGAYGVYQIADVYSKKDELVEEEVSARVYTGAY